MATRNSKSEINYFLICFKTSKTVQISNMDQMEDKFVLLSTSLTLSTVELHFVSNSLYSINIYYHKKS